MSRTYYGRNDEEYDVNDRGAKFHDWITLFNWPKGGIPGDIDAEECRHVAKLIHNFITIASNVDEHEVVALLHVSRKDFYLWPFPDAEELKEFEKDRAFFERCGGLMTEEEWSDLHPYEPEEMPTPEPKAGVFPASPAPTRPGLSGPPASATFPKKKTTPEREIFLFTQPDCKGSVTSPGHFQPVWGVLRRG